MKKATHWKKMDIFDLNDSCESKNLFYIQKKEECEIT